MVRHAGARDHVTPNKPLHRTGARVARSGRWAAALGGHHESAWADHPAVGMDHADQVIEKW